MKYLSAAASNAASIEDLALQAGLKKGGAAKGELVLAIFELANCFRHGWGVPVDKTAARLYYETAANLNDTDAMNEVAWCYLEGFGCKKDMGCVYTSFTRLKGRALRIASRPLSHQPRSTQCGLRMRFTLCLLHFGQQRGFHRPCEPHVSIYH